MLLADCGFANHQLINWLHNSNWHYCLRLPCDVVIHGARKHPIELKYLWPKKSEAIFYHHVGLWLDGEHRCNLVLANVRGVKEPWAVITDEEPYWKRGISYLKIGIRWLKGVLHKGRVLLSPVALLCNDPQPCFASKKAKHKYYDAIWFTRISELKCLRV